MKEIQLSIHIAEHDLTTKLKAAQRFLDEKNRVRLSVRLRGREIIFADLAHIFLAKTAARLKGHIQNPPKLLGKTITCLIVPGK